MRSLKFLICGLVLSQVRAGPLIIRSSIGKLEDHGTHHNGNVFGVDTRMGISNFEAGQGFGGGKKQNFNHVQDGGKFMLDEQDRNVKLDQGNFGGENYHKNGGGTVSDIGEKEGHKKGHQKSGFHNTYHKDESGSNSSYFDDALDEGGKYNHDSRSNNYGNVGNNRQNGYYSTGNDYNKANTRNGGYNSGSRYENDQGDRNKYNKERYYNDQRHGGRNDMANMGQHYGKRVNEEELYVPHGHHDYYDPYYSNSRIAVYEDPMYAGRVGRNSYDRYNDDRLEFRPPMNQHYHNRPNYDYYY